MRVLITGSNGLLGNKLLSLLANEPGIELHATGRGPNRNPTGNYEYHKVDLEEEGALHNLFEQEHPDVVIHTAAMTNVDECELNPKECQIQNVLVTEFVVRACEHFDCFLIHVSTDFIFDGKDGPYGEDAKPNPLSEYGSSKLAAEDLIKKSGLDWAIVRTILVYGVAADPGRSNIVLWVKKSLEEGKALKLINDQWRMPTLAEDLALGCWLIAKKKAKGVFNISGGDMLNPYQIGLTVAEVFELNTSLISETDSTAFTQPAKRPAKTGFILDKAKNLLGYSPRSFKEGLHLVKSQLP
jgi:dTDP-4-dehydrorhamnose reductase